MKSPTFFFDVYGWFEVDRDNGQVLSSQPALWKQAEADDEGLSTAIGCYMFCIRHGNKVTPWYVGKTLAEGGFAAEVFTPHKLAHYAESMKMAKGYPIMFLFPLMTGDHDKMRFSRNRSQGKRVIEWLEKTMMVMAVGQNDNLRNTKDLTLLRSVRVRGILGKVDQGRPFEEVKAARLALLGF